MFKLFKNKKSQDLEPELPSPRAPNGEVKEANRHIDLAMESIQSCIGRTREARKAAKKVSQSLLGLSPADLAVTGLRVKKA